MVRNSWTRTLPVQFHRRMANTFGEEKAKELIHAIQNYPETISVRLNFNRLLQGKLYPTYFDVVNIMRFARSAKDPSTDALMAQYGDAWLRHRMVQSALLSAPHTFLSMLKRAASAPATSLPSHADDISTLDTTAPTGKLRLSKAEQQALLKERKRLKQEKHLAKRKKDSVAPEAMSPPSAHLPTVPPSHLVPAALTEPIPWYPHAGRYLALRPAFNCDPAYHLSGAYYSQDAASQLVIPAVSAGHTEGLYPTTPAATAVDAGGASPATTHAGLTFTATDAKNLFSGLSAAASLSLSQTTGDDAGVDILPHIGLSQRPLRVLDLCAAPGGKGTLLRQWLHEDSLLVSNEIDPRRAQALLENVHKQGSGRGADALVISCSLEDLLARGDMRAAIGLPATDEANTCAESVDSSTARPAADGVWEYPSASTGWTAYDRAVQHDAQTLLPSTREPVGFEGFFDVVLIDAPCSGSAMFRKARAPLENWSTSLVDSVTDTQRRLIDGSLRLLRRPGGLLVYMTCSFDEAENARHIAWVHSHRTNTEPTRTAAGDNSHISSADTTASRCFPTPAPLLAVEAASQTWGLRTETLPTHRGSAVSEGDGVHARDEGHVVFTGLPSAARLEGCFAAGLVMAAPQAPHAPTCASERLRSHFLPPARTAARAARAPAHNTVVADPLALTADHTTTAASSAAASPAPPPSSVTISVADAHALGQYYIAPPSVEAALGATWLAPSAFDKYALLLEFKPQLPHVDAEKSAAQGSMVDFRVECHLFPRAHLPILQWLGPVRADTAFRELGSNNPQRRAGYALDPRVDAHTSPQGSKAHLSRPSILAAGHHVGTLALTLEPKHAQYLLTRLQRSRAHTPLTTVSKARNIKLKTKSLAFVPSHQLALESPTLLHPSLRNQALVSLTRAEAMSFAAQPQAMRAWSSLSMQVAAVAALRWAFTRYAAGQVAKVLQLYGSAHVAKDVAGQISVGDNAMDRNTTPVPPYTAATMLSCRRLLSSLRLLAAVEQEALWQLALGTTPREVGSVAGGDADVSNHGYAALISAAVARAEHEQLLQPLGADILGLHSGAYEDVTSPTMPSSAAVPNDVMAIARACVDDIAQSQWGVDVVAVRVAAAALEDELAAVLMSAGLPTTNAPTDGEALSSSIASWLRSPEAIATLRPAIDAIGMHLSKEARSAAAAANIDADAATTLDTLSTHLPAEGTNACRHLLAQAPSAALWTLLAHPDAALSSAGEAMMPSSIEQAKDGVYGPLEHAMLQALQNDSSSFELASERQNLDAEVHTGTPRLEGTPVGGGATPHALFTPLVTPPLLHAVPSAAAESLAAPILQAAAQTTPSPWARALLRAASARPVLSLAALQSARTAEGTLALVTCDGLPVGWLQKQAGNWVSLAPRSWRIARYQTGEVLLDMLAFGEAQTQTGLDCSMDDVPEGEDELVTNHDQERDEDCF